MVANMIRRALRAGIEGRYLLADVWFSSKAMIRLCQETALTAILRMRKNKMKYRVSEYIEAKQHFGLLKQQSNHYAAYIASLHLTVIRFCMLIIAKQTQDFENITQIRQNLCSNTANISFAAKLSSDYHRCIG